MTNISKKTICFKQIQFIIFLGLLLVGGQVEAQQATKVNVVNEDFERPGFSGNYIDPNPGIWNFYDFTYATSVPMADDAGKCIITKNSNLVGHGEPPQWPHPDHTTGSGYYLFAVKEAGTNPQKIYAATIPYVKKGETVQFGVYYDDVDGGYNFEIQATGTGLGGQTKTSANYANSNGGWVFWSHSVTATQDGAITFSLVDKYGYDNKKHKFGVDDITVSMKAIQMASPASLYTYTKINTRVTDPFQAKYNNPLGNEAYSYVWQKYNGSSWVQATGTGVTGGANGTSFTAEFVPAAESAPGPVYYRLVVAAGSKTLYSDIITVEYTATDYLFKEDFGGSWPSTDSTNQAGASGDWWITAGPHPTITTDFTYGDPDDRLYNRDKAEQAYGERPIKLDIGGAATYAITKLAGWKLPIPGFPGIEWNWGDGDGGGKGGFEDHSISGDNSKGYFMYAVNRTNTEKTVYEASIPVTTDMLRQTFSLSTWQVALWGRVDTLPYQFKLEVEDAAGVVMDFAKFKVSDEWEERKLLFYIPGNYQDDAIKIRISSVGDNLWLGLDDISLTGYESFITIKSPVSGSIVGFNVDFTVDYKYISPTINYRWQRSADGNGWADIVGSDGTATGESGTFTVTVPAVVDGYYYRVLAIKGNDDNVDFTDALASAPVQLFRDANYLVREDFGGCGSTQNFIYKADNPYVIPGYEYTPASEGTVRPNPGSGNYIITNQVYLNYWTNEDHSESTTNWNTDVTDHSSCKDGYFLLVHARGTSDGESMPFYKTMLSNLCGGSKLSFKAWIANLEKNSNTKQNFKFLVSFDNGNIQEYTTGDIRGGSNSLWIQYGFDFFVPQGATTATLSLFAEGAWDWGKGFALDDIEIKLLSPAQIFTPAKTEIIVLSGKKETLTGSYACGSLTGSLTYQWQQRTETGEWVNCSGTGATGTVANGNFMTDYTTNAINETVYYRFIVTGENGPAHSDWVKFIPEDASKSKTYFVCPDNMTEDQAGSYRGSSVYLPGMVSLGEPGYLPSLIHMEAPEITGVTYKWYTSEFGGLEDLLPDQDEYDHDQKYSSVEAIKDPIILSDGMTHTLSVQNERNTDGQFKARTYWVEVCDMNGVPILDKRVAYYLLPGYLCGSVDAVISPANARRIHRENFGGTAPGDPNVKQEPIDYIKIDYELYKSGDGNLPEGGYMITKKSPAGSSNGWMAMPDHIYEDLPNETHGYLVAVNATETPGRFYTHQLTNLGACRNIELVITGWFTSFVKWNGLEKVNLKFILTNTDTGETLAEYLSGNMLDGEGNNWRQFGFRFPVPDEVTGITLEVVNNNFGTGGGNDVLMDDIEIYLVIPPVTLVPSVNGYVCGKDEGVLTLHGTYTDDGTLGNYLDYQWEYSPIGKDGPWQPLASVIGEVTSGVITTDKSKFEIYPFTAANNGYYRLVVGQSGSFDGTPNYACMAISEPRELLFAASVDKIPAPSLSDNRTAFCYSDVDEDGYITITNQDTQVSENNPYASYTWMVGGTVVSDTTAKAVKLKLEDYAPGFYTVSLTANNSVGCTEASMHEFVLFPKVTTWTGNGETNNWNDFRNWDNGVPGYCTNVIIPNESITVDQTTLLDHYPLLIKPTVDSLNIVNNYTRNQSNLNLQKEKRNDGGFSLRPACDTITFKMGGGVARTNYLNYRFAEVDLDVKHGRWYTVSAPLRAMYSGDYFVEGSVKRQNPAVYMMKYNTSNPQTGENPAKVTGDFSNPFNTLTEELSPGLGYAIGVYKGEDIAAKLQSFRFPKDSTAYSIWNYHGVYLGKTTTIDRSGLGRFTYEQRISMDGNLPLNRDVTGFDVIVNNDQYSYTTALLGNPFMSHLDFSQFKTANPEITGGYYIWSDNETFEAYNPGVFSSDPKLIAPMQSFIVEKTGQLSRLQFDFMMSTTTSGVTLRSTRNMEEAILQMDVLRDQVSQSHIRLKYVPFEDNRYSARKDMWTLFSEEKTEPAVLYTLLDGKAASIRTLGDLSEPVELGIRTDVKGELTLRLSGMETFDASQDIYLQDTYTGTLQNMRENSEYTFDNHSGPVKGRLFLRIGEIDEDDIPDAGIRITTYKGRVIASSPADDPIESVKIHALSGRLMYNKQSIRQSSVSLNVLIPEQVVLITVTTRNRQKTEKVIIR